MLSATLWNSRFYYNDIDLVFVSHTQKICILFSLNYPTKTILCVQKAHIT